MYVHRMYVCTSNFYDPNSDQYQQAMKDRKEDAMQYVTISRNLIDEQGGGLERAIMMDGSCRNFIEATWQVGADVLESLGRLNEAIEVCVSRLGGRKGGAG